MNRGSIIAMAALTLAGAAAATTWVPVRLKCPIGGERFASQAMASNSTFGQRPDGRPYSPMPVPPIPECPGNGFMMFDEKFTRPEIAALTEAVASAEYQAMRAAETPYYRAWWLLLRSGRGDRYGEAALALTASWESDDTPERKARYQRGFAELAMALQRDEAHAATWLYFNLRAANALRELGQFDAAAAHLSGLDKPELLPADPEQRAGAREFIDGLRAQIAARNRASEPLAMIPADYAAWLCVKGRADPADMALCEAPRLAEAIAGAKAALAEAEAAASQAAMEAAAPDERSKRTGRRAKE